MNNVWVIIGLIAVAYLVGFEHAAWMFRRARDRALEQMPETIKDELKRNGLAIVPRSWVQRIRGDLH